ncbi:hypothetical protein NUH86_14865 [Sphingobium sp. JS3065]|uniref:hypothetical protein n=1 Tax=Sphingobium sp. JS3065 TaxID=2970925 RepID=UPI002264F959|nr:hypothetical protein [Sphingobium sp. JS3065]UZW54750.1 hypothetical protein NUH86_14865 [Sphingobium sp. JS3065]
MLLQMGSKCAISAALLAVALFPIGNGEAKTFYQIQAKPTQKDSEKWLNGNQYVDDVMPNSIVRIVSIRDTLPDKQSTFRVYIKHTFADNVIFGPDDIKISFSGGSQISMIPYEELEGRLRRDIKRRSFLAAMGGALSAGGANGYTSGTFGYSGTTSTGTQYNGTGMYSGYDPALAQQQRQAAQRQQNSTDAAIRARDASGGAALAGLIRKSTVRPGEGFGGTVAYEIPASIKKPAEVPVSIIVQVGTDEHKIPAGIFPIR